MEKVNKNIPKMGPRRNVGAVEKAKDIKGTLKKLSKRYLKNYKKQLAIVFIFAIASTVFAIVGPKILGNATTEIFNGIVKKISGTGGIDFGAIGKILLILVTLYIVSMIFSIIQGLVMTRSFTENDIQNER